MAKTKIIDSASQIRVKLLSVLKEESQTLFKKASPIILENTKRLVRSSINNSEAIFSLLGSDFSLNNLKKQFGLTDEEAVKSVDEILDAVVDSINIIYNTNGKSGLISSITIEILPESLQQNMGKYIGVYTSGVSGSQINWLEWLLTKGYSIVVSDFRLFLKESEASRAGGAIMVKQEGSGYRVDSRFAGTIGDNFLTRAIESVLPEILLIIQQTIKNI